jgi:hypothetical protein
VIGSVKTANEVGEGVLVNPVIDRILEIRYTMTTMKIHITNYLGDQSQANKTGTTIRQSRERTLGLVLTALNDHWQGIEVVLWNQQPYEPKHRNVRVIDTLPQPVAGARNGILGNFYASDDDWCAILDNDIGVYHDDKDRLDTRTFIDHPQRLLDQLTGRVAAFSPFHPQHTPYAALKDQSGTWNQMVKNNWLFQPTINLNGMVFHSNYPKIWGREFYYDETIDVLEDCDFACQLWKQGLFVGKLQNVFMKEYSNKSTIFLTQPRIMPHNGRIDWDDGDDRTARMKAARQQLEQKYGVLSDLYRGRDAVKIPKPRAHLDRLFDFG